MHNRYGLPREKTGDFCCDYSEFIENAFHNAAESNAYKKAVYTLGKIGFRKGKPIAGYVDAFCFNDGQEGPAFIIKTEPEGEGFCAIRCSDETCHNSGNVLLPYFEGTTKWTLISTDVLSAWSIAGMLQSYLIVAADLNALVKKVKEGICKKYIFICTNSCEKDVIDKVKNIVCNEGYAFEEWQLELPQSDFYSAMKASPLKAFLELTENVDGAGRTSCNRIKNTIVENMKTPKRYAISTGFSKLDEYLGGGLQAGLYFIAGMPGVGKTTFMLQLCDWIAMQGHKTLFFSFEMRANKLIRKSISRDSVTTFRGIYGRMPEKSEALSIDEVKHYMNYPLKADASFTRALLIHKEKYQDNITYFDLNDQIIPEDRNSGFYNNIDELIQCVSSYKKAVVFIDYLQMLKLVQNADNAVASTSERLMIDKILDRLRNLSEEFRCPVVLTSTMSRSASSGYGGPVRMESLKESGGIEYKADVILGLEYASGSAEKSQREGIYGSYYLEKLRILKNKEGVASVEIPYNYFGTHAYFEEADTCE